MAGLLERFLAAESERAFCWGTRDCLLFLADWVCAQTGIDPAAGYRGRYANRADAYRIVRQAGGMAPLVERLLTDRGVPFTPTDVQSPRSFGVVRLPEPTGAIWTGRFWACPAETGVALRLGEPIKTWEIKCHKRLQY